MYFVPRVSSLRPVIRRSVAPSAVALVLLLGLGTAFGQGSNPPPSPADAAATGYPSNEPSRWPLRIDSRDGGSITVYQPQLTSFDGNRLSARAAVSIMKSGQPDATFGAVWMDSRVSTDRAARTVQILDVVVTKARFPESDGMTEKSLTDAMMSALPRMSMTLSLDHLLTSLDVAGREKDAVKEIASDPPKIVVRDRPAVLLQYDGAPRLVQVPDTSMLRVVNTPFFVVLDSAKQAYYLKGAGRWFVASDPVGAFRAADQVPPYVADLATQSGYADPQQPLADSQGPIDIITATEPTELIWSNGAQEFTPIAGTDLLYVANTASDVFLEIPTQQIFVLLSGRWYTSSAHNGPYRWNGPWVTVDADKLPEDFKRIPMGSPKADVLAHVAGTNEARDAVADTFVPQTAAIDRRNYQQPNVAYDGNPNFTPIENTSMTYAVNTPSSVIWCRGLYYCCSNAVWYVSNAPVGPWELCTQVPEEIYTIPASCPLFPVRYCRVYDATPQYVFVGYLPGYIGCYPHHGVVVYGTGFRYAPWVGRAYYPRPHTFGYGARYDAYSGHWGFNIGLTLNSGPVWIGSTVPFANGWFGHGGYRPFVDHHDYDSRPSGVDVRFRSEFNLYERRKDVHFEGPGPEGPRPVEPVRDDKRPNDVYVDRQGSVFRKTPTGWEQRDHNQWVSHPDPAPASPSGPPGPGQTLHAPHVIYHPPGESDVHGNGSPGPSGIHDQGPREPAGPPKPDPSGNHGSNAGTSGKQDPPRESNHEPAGSPKPDPSGNHGSNAGASGKQDPPRESNHEPAGPPKPDPSGNHGSNAGNAGKQDPPKESNHEPAGPNRDMNHGDINGDYKARVSGGQRKEDYHPAPAPAPAPAPSPAPAQPTHGGGNNGGNGGGTNGGGKNANGNQGNGQGNANGNNQGGNGPAQGSNNGNQGGGNAGNTGNQGGNNPGNGGAGPNQPGGGGRGR